MIKLIFESILLFLFVALVINSITEILYNLRNKQRTYSITWIIPALVFAVFWFIHNY